MHIEYQYGRLAKMGVVGENGLAAGPHGELDVLPIQRSNPLTYE